MYAVIYHVIKLIILVYLIFRIMKIKIKKKQYAENSGKITLDYIFFLYKTYDFGKEYCFNSIYMFHE